MSKFTQTLCILFAFVSLFLKATRSRPQPALQYDSAPENPPSCDSFKLRMYDCSMYLKEDSSMAEPSTSCCSGVMDVWKVDSKCAGEVLTSIVNLRNMNETRVTHVSSTCGFMDISLDKYLEASLLEARLSADKAKAVRNAVIPFAVMLLVIVLIVGFGLCGLTLLLKYLQNQVS